MRVVGLNRYPVKSLRGHALEEATVELIGFAGDRRWLVVDPEGRFITIREVPAMTTVAVEPLPHGIRLSHPDHGRCDVPLPQPHAPKRSVTIWRDTVLAQAAAPEAGAFLSAVLGRAAALVYLDDPAARPVDPHFGTAEDHVSFADGYPMLLTSIGSLDDLSERHGGALDMRRFRPNIVVDGFAPWDEDFWKIIRIGGVVFRVVKPCGRCVVVTRDPDTGTALGKGEPLKTLGRFRRSATGSVIFGQNLIPGGTGVIRLGDPVEIVASGRSNLLAAE